MDAFPVPDVHGYPLLQQAQWVIDMAFEQNKILRKQVFELTMHLRSLDKKVSGDSDLCDRLQDKMGALRQAAEKNHLSFHGSVSFMHCPHDICREIHAPA